MITRNKFKLQIKKETIHLIKTIKRKCLHLNFDAVNEYAYAASRLPLYTNGTEVLAGSTLSLPTKHKYSLLLLHTSLEIKSELSLILEVCENETEYRKFLNYLYECFERNNVHKRYIESFAETIFFNVIELKH